MKTLSLSEAAKLKSCTALTMVEVLVVMSVIVIIVSTIVVAVFAVQRRGQIKATESLLEQLAQALEQYKATHRMYVPAGADPPDRSTYALWQALEYEDKLVNIDERFKMTGESKIWNPRTGASMDRSYYVDAWEQPLRYSCAPPNKLYTLVSAGVDLVFDSGDEIERR